jgi:starvation-inducible DNA-binding protein
MDDLIEQMKVVLASVFALYLKTHYFHWNIEGPNFPQYHSFLNDLYDDIHDSVDTHAEQIRTMGAYAPGSFIRYKDLSVIQDEVNIPAAMSMMTQLQKDNLAVIVELKKANDMAEKQNAVGTANFLQERIDKHYKHDWMLKSIIKA